MVDNPMQEMQLEKVVLNIGIGANEQLLENAKALLKRLTGREAVATHARSREPSLNIRKGQVIGAMVTLRRSAAVDMLKRALDANNNVMNERSITDNTLSFGIKEYIDFTGVKYDPKIGMLGMNVNAQFGRKGRRVQTRRAKRSRLAKRHARVSRDDVIAYITKNFGVKFANE